ncbi:MAG: hypothetical protein WAM69_07245 [Candidatus Sulfotelmatobacter sp.]
MAVTLRYGRIAGTSDIEVVNNLNEGDEVITGGYKILHTLRSGSSVKIDDLVAKEEERTQPSPASSVQRGVRQNRF